MRCFFPPTNKAYISKRQSRRMSIQTERKTKDGNRLIVKGFMGSLFQFPLVEKTLDCFPLISIVLTIKSSFIASQRSNRDR